MMGNGSKTFATDFSGINSRYGLLFCKDKGFFFVSYLLFYSVLAKIKCEAKLVRCDNVSTSDAAGRNGQF